MPLYVDDKGGRYEIPADPTPQEVAEIRQLGLRPEGESALHHNIRDSIGSFGSGATEGMIRAPLIGGDAIKGGLSLVNALQPGTISPERIDSYGSQGWVDALRGSDTSAWLKKHAGIDLLQEPETTWGRYAHAIGSSIGGGAAMGALGGIPGLIAQGGKGLAQALMSLKPGAVIANGAAGAGGEAAYDASRGFDESKPGNPIAALAGSVGTAGVMNALRLARAPNFDQQAYNATKSMSEADWRKAALDRQTYENSGSKSYTLADLPPLQPRIGGLAQDLSNATGGDLLRQKLSIQARTATPESDVPQLLKSLQGDAWPHPVDPREMASILRSRGQGAFPGAPGITPTTPIPGAPPQGPAPQPIGAPPLLANRGLGPVAPSIAPPLQLPGPPGMPPPRPGVAPQSDAVPPRPGSNAETVPFRFTPNLPLEAQLPGTVRNVSNIDNILSRLRDVPSHKLQEEITRLGLPQDETLRLAAVVAQKLKPMGDYTAAADWAKKDREIFLNLLDSVDPTKAAKAGDKLGVIDSVVRLKAEHGADRTTQMDLQKNPLQLITALPSTIARRSGLRTGEKETEKISNLFGNPTPQNLKELERLSQTDPRLAKRLQVFSSLVGAAESQGSDRSGK